MKQVNGYYESWGLTPPGFYRDMSMVLRRDLITETQICRQFYASNPDDKPTIEAAAFIVDFTPPVMLTVAVGMGGEVSASEEFELIRLTDEVLRPIHLVDHSPRAWDSTFYRSGKSKFIIDIIHWDHFGEAHGIDEGIPFLQRFFKKYAPSLSEVFNDMLAFALPKAVELKPDTPQHSLLKEKFDAIRNNKDFPLRLADEALEKFILGHLKKYGLLAVDTKLADPSGINHARQQMLDTLPYKDLCDAYANAKRQATPTTTFHPSGKPR